MVLFTIRAQAGHTRVRVRVPIYWRGVNLALAGGVFLTGLAAVRMSFGVSASSALLAVIAASAAIGMLPFALGGVAGTEADTRPTLQPTPAASYPMPTQEPNLHPY